jgi:hypothetical protein
MNATLVKRGRQSSATVRGVSSWTGQVHAASCAEVTDGLAVATSIALG